MIHQYKNNDYNIVLDVNSGLVHIVEDIVYDIIPLFENENKDIIVNKLKDKYNESDLIEAIEEVGYLKKNKQLFTEDIYKDYITEIKGRDTVVKALCLHIAHDCNLACKYCFAEEGEYHGRRALMDTETGKKAIDFLVKNSGNRINLEVDFFGGEPLMNFQVVKDIVEYGRSLEKEYNKNFRFTLTTNGILLNDDIIEFANKEMSNVVLSLDGRKEINDKMRPFRNGKGSYDLIVPKYQKFVSTRGDKDYYVRGTFTRDNLNFADDVIHFADLGFKQLSIEPVVGEDGEEFSIRTEDIEEIKNEYDKLARIYINRYKDANYFNFFHFMIDLNQGPCVAKRLSGCGAGSEYLAVTPWGDLYPCHQFVGYDDFLMGNVTDGLVDQEIKDDFKDLNIYTKAKCTDCFAKFYCSGGCAANSYKFTHKLNDVYEIGCELQRKRVECAIMIKAALAD